MQRHDALAPLSRDHHHALMLARGLKRDAHPKLQQGLPSDLSERAAYVRRFFEEQLAPHFAAEEEVLIPAVRGLDKALDQLLEAVLEEHAAIRALIAQLEDADDLPEVLDALGRTLIAHVRKEERQLFEQVQARLSEGELRALAPRVAACAARACPTERLRSAGTREEATRRSTRRS